MILKCINGAFLDIKSLLFIGIIIISWTTSLNLTLLCGRIVSVVFVPLVAGMGGFLLEEGQTLHLAPGDDLMVDLFLIVVQRAQVGILVLDVVVSLGRSDMIPESRRY